MTTEQSGVNASGYRVLARKYRPTTFADLIGQEAVVRTLTNAFATGRIAQAYMLTGVRGVGKTTTARLIARAINYPPGPTVEMPEVTPQCEAILESRHVDVIEMDAASNTGVDNMREIIDSVRYAPVSARYKVYVIDEVHMLSKSAFNALLKTLEEPPPHVKFVFATTEIRKVPVTILSRCQRFDLKRLDSANLTGHLANVSRLENVAVEDEALRMIARAAEGSVRDALSILDQAIAYGSGGVQASDVAAMLGLMDRGRVIDIFDAVMTGDAARALSEIEAQYASGADPETILADLADFTHWVTRLKVVGEAALADPARTEEEKSRGTGYAARIGIPHLTRAWQMLLKGIAETAVAAEPLMAAEMLLIRLAHAAELPAGEELAKRVLETGATAPEGVPARPAPSPRRDPAGGPPLQPARQAAVALADQVPHAPPSQVPESRAISTFREIVALAGERRDIKLKNELERFVRPIRVAAGQMEIALEDSGPPGLAGELARKLEAWTGQRWIVMLAKEGGEAPIAHQERDSRARALRELREHPDVAAVLRRFPGAEILDIRDTAPERPMEETDEESR